MSKELDNIFIDVRNSFRLLNRYQKRMLQIVSYIREQTPFNDMWGSKDWYSAEIGKRRDSPDSEYAKLNVRKDMWGWDFLYGYIFEYYFGAVRINKKNQLMKYTTKYCQWLHDPAFPDDDYKAFLTKFLESTSDTSIFKYDNGEVEVLKKYEMQKFATQQGADDVIRNFGKIIKEQADVELFKSSFYK